MKESVVYQEIFRTGEQRGISIGEQRGISIGEQRGEEKTAIKWITSLLTHQLGEVDSSLKAQIQGLSIQQLEALRDAAFDFQSEQDLRLWLAQL